jgi:hypothetical protein
VLDLQSGRVSFLSGPGLRRATARETFEWEAGRRPAS